ncbi:hypothetical protein M1K46_21780 [Fictibacillus sp. WQ 8-8]|uniref:hypothetical protein n=1 Tax=Fictibacillus sp. WQ 8-8 TaxID=2938788 RepID=UPI00210C950B|nr:hypothetical protein [Fictibacillus sp. WQ 8-8]MCQ6268242.1 hypothetical protein [Fictibacillus sp. WQ 8-8]
MKEKFIILLDNNKIFLLLIFILSVLGVILNRFAPAQSSILVYLFLTLFYARLIRSSIIEANTVFRQVIWLISAPVILALLPFMVIGVFIPMLINNDLYFFLIYVFFFILTWVFVAFVFDIEKIKVAVQIVNALFLSILSVTFVFYFTPDLLKDIFSKEVLVDIKKDGLEIESLIDLFIKLLTIPYILSGIWVNVAIAYREYKNASR